MFDGVSPRYDRTNTMLSLGNAIFWRAATTRAVQPRLGERILDLAAGTGTSSASLARSGAMVVAADFSPGMIAVGSRKHRKNSNIEFVVADGTDLPFEENTFDAVTISFGLRNIQQPQLALSELCRVTKPGGRIVICEFSNPPGAVVRSAYAFYLHKIMPILAKRVSSHPSAYTYLADSIRDWPDQKQVAGWLRQAGFHNVEYRNLTAGIVALHRADKPIHVNSDEKGL